MNWLDITFLVIIALSAGISLLRGFIKEALSLIAWVAALWVAIQFTDSLAAVLEGFIQSITPRLVVAFAILFLVTLLAGALVNHLASQLVRKSGMGGTDRILGVIFGIARGIVVVGILVLGAGLTTLPKETWWQASLLTDHFEQLAIWMRDFLPPDAAKHVVFPS